MLFNGILINYLLDSVFTPDYYFTPRKPHRCKNGECKCEKKNENNK